MNGWLANLQKAHEGPALPSKPQSELVKTERKLPLELRATFQTDVAFDSETDTADPFARFLEKSQLGRFHKSAVENESWDAPLLKTEKLPADFVQRSNARFEKTCNVIRRVFAGHPEECAEAIDLAKRMRDEARAAALAAAAA